MKIKGKINEYQLVVGLETHAQLNTKKKLFSSSDNNFNCAPNSNVCFFDLAFPGQLPTINYEVVDYAIRFGLAIDAKINQESYFDRKHYFYPDSPSGYQITQLFKPIIENGKVKINSITHSNEKITKEIEIVRAHLEQDAGKLVHDKHPHFSYVDYNRAGVPLLEIVTSPCFRTIDEVILYLESLQQILRTTNVCLADLEKGTFRCDANISLMNLETNKFGTRCEIKNLNSFKFIRKAIEFEVQRQFELLEAGKIVDQETRLFNVKTGETETLRSKEDALDYRYFPDPDLPPLVISDERILEIKKQMPELPEKKAERYLSLGISEKEVKFLCSDLISSRYFDEVLKAHDAKITSTWVLNELSSRLSKINKTFENSPIKAERLIALINLIKEDKINGKIAKEVLDIMIEDSRDPSIIVEEKGLIQVISEDFVKQIAIDVINQNPKQIEEFKKGNEKIFGFLVGQGIKLSQGKINPQTLGNKIKELI